jgi:glycosyltransferase involved in cell wall biosynthesis
MPGRVENIVNYYQVMDIFVLPSYSEGMPNAILEAMACQVASIGSDIPGISEVIDQGIDGFKFRRGDSSDLKKEILLLINDSSLRKRIGLKARYKILTDHNLNKNCNLYRKLFLP